MAPVSCICPSEIWITAAFKSSRENEAYIFMKKEFVLYSYSQPMTSGFDKILTGPSPTADTFSFLKCTVFDDLGIQGAFGSHTPGRAFIFAANQVAEMDYAPYGGCGKLVRGPMPIGTMFPFLRGTAFENGIDAAFESSVPFQAYLFKGDQAACISYGNACCGASGGILSIGRVREQWPCFKGTMFENGGIDGAFTFCPSRGSNNHVFLFKGNFYVRVQFTLCKNTPRIAWRPTTSTIKGYRKALGDVLPRRNY